MTQISHGKRPLIVVDDAVPFIDNRLHEGADVVFLPTREINPQSLRHADAVIGHTRTRYNEQTLGGTPVRLACTCTIGMDHIDTEWCRQAGITIRNAPGCNAPAVAQYVWSALLNCGFDPASHTLGIVGHGHVGSVVAEWGRLLGARILYNDPPKADAGLQPVPGVSYLPLEEVLRNSDAVTLHTPLTTSGPHPSFHLIGKEQLAMMPTGSILVNAARGPVTDTEPLLQETYECRLRAIIDTWEGEPDFNRRLLDTVEIGTFHIAGYSLEGKQRATRAALEAVSQFFGIPVDLAGLAPAYTPKTTIDPRQIVASYNPYADMQTLVQHPDDFDQLRKDYTYRKEV